MKRLTCVLAFLLYFLLSPPLVAAKNPFFNSSNLDMITPEGRAFFGDSTFYQPVRNILLGDDAAALVQLRDLALQGDFNALAALALITRLHEQLGRTWGARIPAQFWEDWMYRLLGEREGGYILGAAAQANAIIANSYKTSSLFDGFAAEALRRAGNAGHPEAMFGLTVLVDRFPDPDFRTPNTPDFPIAPYEIVGNNYSPEGLYWLSKAAAYGSARADRVLGVCYLDPEKWRFRDTAKGIKYLKQSVSAGNGMSARASTAYLNPIIEDEPVPEANCPETMYYTALYERMQDDEGRLDMEKAGYRPYSRGFGKISLTELFDQMRDGKGAYAQCLTSKEEFHALLAESRVEYEAIRASLEAKQRDKDVLYNRARARLPEFRAAYEKIMRELEPAVTPGAAPEPPHAPDEKKSEEDSSPQDGGKFGSEQCSLTYRRAL